MSEAHSMTMGGSNAAQRINCPGSYALEHSLPKSEASEFAVRGSLLHAAVEMVLTAEPTSETEAEALYDELEGQDLGFGEEWAITREWIDTKIRPAVDCFYELVDRYDLDDWRIEQRVTYSADTLPGAFGTADIIGINRTSKVLVMGDFKFGDGVPVSPEGNYQMGFYAGAALYDDLNEDVAELLGETIDDRQWPKIVMAIIQPREGFSEDVLQVWETDDGWVENMIDLATNAMAAAAKPDAPLKPGPHCRWCNAKAICPAQESMALQALATEPATVTPQELSKLATIADMLKPWISDVYKLLEAELENGHTVPGYKLVPKQSRRQWVDEKKLDAELKRRKLKVDERYAERKLLSPAQFQKRHKDVYAQLEAEHVVWLSSGTTVAPDSDQREAVVDSFALLANAMSKANIQLPEVTKQ